LFSVYEAKTPVLDDSTLDNAYENSPFSLRSDSSSTGAASSLPTRTDSTQLSPKFETIPDMFLVGSFLSKTHKVVSEPKLLHVLSDDATRETYLLQEHNYTMKLQLADLALVYNLEQYCDINKFNRGVVCNHRQYEREWNTFMSECKKTKRGNYEKAQLAIKWIRKAIRKRYTVDYKVESSHSTVDDYKPWLKNIK